MGQSLMGVNQPQEAKECYDYDLPDQRVLADQEGHAAADHRRFDQVHECHITRLSYAAV
jgi:hypothetical protein